MLQAAYLPGTQNSLVNTLSRILYLSHGSELHDAKLLYLFAKSAGTSLLFTRTKSCPSIVPEEHWRSQGSVLLLPWTVDLHCAFSPHFLPATSATQDSPGQSQHHTHSGSISCSSWSFSDSPPTHHFTSVHSWTCSHKIGRCSVIPIQALFFFTPKPEFEYS